MEKELVSIIIPTYKRAALLPQTIESVLNQNYKNIEIIVVDDNNPDTEYRTETEKMMSKYKNNRRVKYIKHPQNMNGCVARNTGLKECKGEYVCFLDDDDIIYKDKIVEQVDFLKKNNDYNAVYCARREGKYIHSPKISGDLTYYLLSGERLIITIMIMFRKKSIENISWNINLKRNQEAGFLLEFFSKGNKIGYMESVLCETRLDDRTNMLKSSSNEKEMLKYLNTYINLLEDSKIKRKVFCKRYVGITLSYIKEKKFIGAMGSYFRGCKHSVCLFNYYFLEYVIRKMFNKKNDYYLIGDKNEEK